MQAVGRIGSYISKGVYTVSGTFHPFGGAVDIIVVLQPDGSYKSSPWYVRFGKFQGVLKSKEKLVRISVNGEEAGFYMHLDSKGEAFFMKEVDMEEEVSAAFSPPSSSGEDTDGQNVSRRTMKSKSCSNWSERSVNEGDGNAISRTNSRPSQIFGLVFGGRAESGGIPAEGHEMDVIRTESMARAEMAADLLELKWSTNLVSSRRNRDIDSRFPAEVISRSVGQNVQRDGCTNNERSCGLPPSCQEAENTVQENGTEIKCVTSEYMTETATSIGSVQGDTSSNSEQPILIAEHTSPVDQCLANGDQNTFFIEENISTTEIAVYPTSESPDCDIPCSFFPENSNGESLLFGNLDGLDSREAEHVELIQADNEEEKVNSIFSVRVADGDIGSSQSHRSSNSSADQFFDSDVEKAGLRNVSSDVNINKIGDVQCEEIIRAARSLPSMSPISNSCDVSINYDDQAQCVLPVSEDMEIRNEHIGPQNPPVGHMEIPPKPVDGSRRGWPFSFKRSRSVKVSPTAASGCQNYSSPRAGNTSESEGANGAVKCNMNKKKIITLTPTSEQLASLNLKEGKNVVIFTFSTAMLGNQQVDARIFLWRWDSRIVISDVDGTITRSDLLGQVMPLVGMDWSQTGVAHFFTAIKENGYQLLFLSARSITQAFLTRQFLFNIKQDGKALPEGPVVISPDGLFPSLFREVVRRAPHEFKIACLEDIKALFPADRSPFYAGFGNRDTDEFSYLKVGIPRNKIFIINPKGEIVVNRRVDTKSYVSLHTLVHGMFPAMSSSEEEDFNSWNYWKLPPIDT